jgi:uncharacterized SAM-binding protein YcdF (DUF218 family)
VSTPKSALARVLIVIFSSAALLWVASVLAVIVAGLWPNERGADAIIVLGAAQYQGRPSPVLQARLDHAIDLYHRGLAPRIIFTGGLGRGDTITEAEASRRYALRHDVPAAAIMMEREGVTSAQSVRAAAALMAAAGLESALLVSDSYHMLRLELLARRSHIVPYRAPAPNAPIDLASRRKRWEYVLRESVLFPATAILGGR